MSLESLDRILNDMYQNIESEQGFIPICIANMIICYKFAHNDEVYWHNFARKTQKQSINNIKDIYLFFVDFLPTVSLDDDWFHRKVEHLKQYNTFLSELFFLQKKYSKDIALFEKHLERVSYTSLNPQLKIHILELFRKIKKIRFPELKEEHSSFHLTR